MEQEPINASGQCAACDEPVAFFEGPMLLCVSCLEAFRREVTGLPAKRNVPLRVRRRALSAAGFRCADCGHGSEDGVKLHVDHIVPLSKGGSNDLENLQVLCEECNLGKGDELEHEV